MAQDVWLADRRHARPRYERIVEPRLERLTTDQHELPRRARGGLLVLANILRDTRYALRQLVRTPGFTVSPSSRWRSASARA
jgi:hypothetical protein